MKRWQFSLATLLLVLTLAPVVIAGAVYLATLADPWQPTPASDSTNVVISEAIPLRRFFWPGVFCLSELIILGAIVWAAIHAVHRRHFG